MRKKEPSHGRKMVRDAKSGQFIPLTVSQRRRIKETIEELEKASTRIEEARRYIRRT